MSETKGPTNPIGGVRFELADQWCDIQAVASRHFNERPGDQVFVAVREVIHLSSVYATSFSPSMMAFE